MAGKQADIKVGILTNYDDKGLKQANTGLAGFKQSIADADGVGGKFKAGWGSITDTVKANVATMAVAGGAALVAFGVKAVGAFTDTAKAALDLSTATGLSTEQASRWIAVGDDFEVTAEALQTGLGKIAKTLDDSKWAQYGIETRDASGAARSTNDILLDSFDTLSKVTNETERAAIGQKLFGKGYQSLTPILGKTRAEYEKMLNTVEDGQVITAQEAEKAEKFRLAQDQLGDALKDVTIAIGEQVAGLSPLIVGLAKVIELTGKAFGAGGVTPDTGVLDTLYAMRAEADKGGKSWEAYWAEVDGGKISLDEAITQIEEAAAKVDELSGTLHDGERSWETQTEWLEKAAEATSETDRETRRLTEGMKGGNEAFRDAEPPITDATTALSRFREEVAATDAVYDDLMGNLDEQEAWENVVTKIDEFGKGTKATAQEVRDITRDIAGYVEQTNTIPVSKKTEIFAALRDGDIAEAERLLAELTRTREIYLTLTGPGATTAAGYDNGRTGTRASGGPVMSGGNYLVGEQGPELLHMNGSGHVTNANDTKKMLNGDDGGGTSNTYNITVQAFPGMNGFQFGQAAVAAIAEYERRSGTDWRRQ